MSISTSARARVCLYVCVCVYVCMYAPVNVFVQVYNDMRLRMYMYMCVYMYLHTGRRGPQWGHGVFFGSAMDSMKILTSN